MTNIYDLTNSLRDVRSRYQAEYIDATEMQKKELAILDRDYKTGSPTYIAKKQEIQLKCDVAVVRAREAAAKKATEAFEDLRQRELAKLDRIDEEALTKVNALKDLPLSEIELKQILKKFGSNVWIQKAISVLAEQNGISTSNLPLDTSIDTKLNIINSLEEQLDKLLRDYDRTANTPEAANARFLWLNDDVLRNSEEIYTNGVVKIKELDAVTQAYLKIRATGTQTAKATLISNSLRNLKKEDSKNALLYRLATDDTIMAEAYQIAGISDVMAEWKHGKAERYAKAIKMMNSIKTMQDTENIKANLRGYINRVEMGSESENEFLRHEITKTYKKNSFIGKALQEMDKAERDTLFGNSIDLVSERPKSQQPGDSTAE